MQPDELDKPPDWLVNIIRNMQKNQDDVYNNKLTDFLNHVHSWIDKNVIERDNGRPTEPFNFPKPQRIIIYPKIGNGFGQYAAPVDPLLTDPVLPPAIPASNVGLVGFSTNAGKVEDETLITVKRIEEKLNFLVSKFS